MSLELIYNIGQLLTMRDGWEVVCDAWVSMENGRIVGVGKMGELSSLPEQATDARGRVVMPGFVDCHTHLLHAGGMHGDFAERCRRVEEASVEELRANVERQLTLMERMGTTTVEMKTGYATSEEAVGKCLEAAPRRRGVVLTEMSPLADTSAARWTMGEGVRFVDALCDPEGLSARQLREPLRTVRGVGIKLHVDVTGESDGVELAIEVGAHSVEHLLHSSTATLERVGRAGMTAVLLPAMAYYTRAGRFVNARKLIDSGARVALATDANPGDAPCWSMAFVVHLAVREMGMTHEEALIAATRNAAYAIGEQERAGTIEAGKDADLLLLDTDDYRDVATMPGTNLVERVWRG